MNLDLLESREGYLGRIIWRGEREMKEGVYLTWAIKCLSIDSAKPGDSRI